MGIGKFQPPPPIAQQAPTKFGTKVVIVTYIYICSFITLQKGDITQQTLTL